MCIKGRYHNMHSLVRNLNDHIKLIFCFPLSNLEWSFKIQRSGVFWVTNILATQRLMQHEKSTYDVQLSQNVHMDNVVQPPFGYKEILKFLIS